MTSAPHGTNAGALWGGRFASGPSDALAALSRSTHFDWRLVPYDLAGSRAHARVLHTAGLLTEADRDALVTGLDRLGERYAAGELHPDATDEDVHGALERLLLDEVGTELGGRLRAAGPATTRSPRCSRPTCATTPASSPGSCSTWPRPSPVRPTSTSARSCPAARTSSTPSRCCSPTTCWRTRGRWSATSVGSATGTPGWRSTRPTARGRWPAPASGLDPRGGRPRPGLPGSSANSIDGTAARDFVAELAFVTAMIGVDVSRQAEEVILWATKEFGFVGARRRLLHRVEHHAAEEEPRHRRAGPRQGRPADRQPGRPARDAQGAAAGLQPRPAGGQGAGLRLRRHARGAAARRSPAWSRRCASTPSGWPSWRRRASRSPPTSPSGWSARACRSGSPTRSPARAYAAARSSAVELDELTDEQLAAIDAHLTPGGARRAHGRGLGGLARRPRRHRAGAGRRAARRAARAAVADHRAWLA